MEKSEDGKQVIPTIIAFEQPDETGKTSTGNMEKLKEVMSVDDLHERTYQKKKDERKLFEEQLMRIAKKEGMVLDESQKPETLFPLIVKTITEDQENEDHLFALKLALFEVEKIRDSDNVDVKTEMRSGTTKAQVLLAALKLISE